MTLGVDEYLAWTPGDMAQGAVWLRLKRDDMEMTATALRNAAADGTAGQSGPYIEARRGAELGRLVELLRDDCAVIREEGFERYEGSEVRDTRTGYENAEERVQREGRALELKRRLIGRLEEIRDRDELANNALHGLVDRPVRDRTPKGNGNPYAAGVSSTSIVAGVTDAVAAAVEGKWEDAAREAGRGLVSVRGLGPAASFLGLMGGVAARPEDEPLFEAIVAEGVGTMAAAGAIPLGVAYGTTYGGPGGGVAGGVAGAASAPFIGQLAASKVRGWFDDAN